MKNSYFECCWGGHLNAYALGQDVVKAKIDGVAAFLGGEWFGASFQFQSRLHERSPVESVG